MTTGNKIKSFIRETKARLKGDTAGKIGEKNLRTADAALELQLAQLNIEKMKAETHLEKTKEKMMDTIHPKELIEDDSNYITGLARVNREVKDAEKTLKDINNSIDFFRGLQKEINEDVDVPSAEEKEEKK